MGWKMSGSYLASCSCDIEEHWTLGQNPDVEPEGGCRGVTVFHISQAEGDAAPLAGSFFAVINLWPEQLTYGWHAGVLTSEDATPEQADLAEKMVTGGMGGPFAKLARQVEDFAPPEPTTISVEPGEEPLVRVGSHSVFKFTRKREAGGELTIASRSLYPFATNTNPGTTAGTPAKAHDVSWLPAHGEHAAFAISDEG